MYKKLMFCVLSVVLILVLTSLAFGQRIGFQLLEEGPPDTLEGKEIHVAIISVPGIMEALHHLPAFEEETGISVTYEILPEAVLREKTTMDLAFGTGLYDAIMFGLMYVNAYAGEGYILPLDQFAAEPAVTDPERIRMDDFLEKALDANRYEGNLYGLPFYAESTLYFYRTDLFEEHGIAPPQSIDDIWDAAEALTLDTTGDGSTDIYGISLRGLRGGGLNVYTWTGFLHGFGGGFFDDDWKPIFDSPEAIASLEYYADILNNFGPPGSATFDWTEVSTWAQESRIAAFLDATPFASMIEGEGSRTRGLWDVVAPMDIAGVDDSTLAPSIYTWCFGIASHSRQPWASWKFISWITSYELQKQLVEDGFYFRGAVARESTIAENPAIQDEYWVEATMAAIEASSPDYRPRIKEWHEVGDRIGVAVSEAIAGEKTAEDALREAARDVEVMMRRAGYYD